MKFPSPRTEIGSYPQMPIKVSPYHFSRTPSFISIPAAKQWEDPTKSRVTRFCELANKGGHTTGVGNIKWIAFMPYTEGFVGVTLVDGGAYLFYEGIPALLETQLHQETTKVIRSVSVGYNGSWIVVYNDGSTRWTHSIPTALRAKLQAGHTSNLEVRPLYQHNLISLIRREREKLTHIIRLTVSHSLS
jgi:hypothetical protein